MDLSIRNIWVLDIGGVEVWITETIRNTWILMVLLIAAAVVVRILLAGKYKDIPRGFQNAVEAIVELFDNFVRDIAGPKFMYLGNWFFMVFVFILVSNLSGVTGFRPPTADWVTTFTFALSTFILIQAIAFKHRKGRYFLTLINPLNLIGELARPISLSFRLFGNILAGTIIMTLYYGLTPIFVQFGIPIFLHAFFDIFAGAMQTYIFCVLSLSFISAAAEP